jgi:hypothetical protein
VAFVDRRRLWQTDKTMASSGLISTAQPLSLRQLQRKALLRLLNLNSGEETTNAVGPNDLMPQIGNGEPVWKFLVFDKMGQDVVSSVLRVSDLREAGVTVHMHLKAVRLQMQDVPASTLSFYFSDLKSTLSNRPMRTSMLSLMYTDEQCFSL